jgi:hypothetical protein
MLEFEMFLMLVWSRRVIDFDWFNCSFLADFTTFTFLF